MTRDKYSVSQDLKKNATRPSKTNNYPLSHLNKVELYLNRQISLCFEFYYPFNYRSKKRYALPLWVYLFKPILAE
jgi:hypothetical protein